MRSKNERSIFIANKFKDKNKLENEENEMAHQVFISHTERDIAIFLIELAPEQE